MGGHTITFVESTAILLQIFLARADAQLFLSQDKMC